MNGDDDIFAKIEPDLKAADLEISQNQYEDIPVSYDIPVIEFVPAFTEEPDGELIPVVSDLRKEIEEQIPLHPPVRLSEREKQVLYAVRTMQYENRVSPTNGELSEIFGLSNSRIKDLVQGLVRKGFLEFSKHKSWTHKRLLMPKGMKFPWLDYSQFPEDIFDPKD